MRLALLALSDGGHALAEKLSANLPNATVLRPFAGEKVAELLAANWHSYDGFVCIMAAGIVVRAIAPLLADKFIDPAIVVMDEKGRHAVSLLSGHIGGANQLAQQVAALSGGQAVITTASDSLELVALDIWAAEQNLVAESRQQMTRAAALLVNRRCLKLYSDLPVLSLPPGLAQVEEPDTADIIVSTTTQDFNATLILRPKRLVVGIGCNRGTAMVEFEEAMTELFESLSISRLAVRNLASIAQKNDETGLLQFATDNGWEIEFFTSNQLNSLENIDISPAALKAVGAIGVAEPAALMSAQTTHLTCRKRKWKNVTMAIAQASFLLSAQAPGPRVI